MSSSTKTPKGKRKGSEKPVPPGAPKKGKKEQKRPLKTELFTESGKPVKSDMQYMATCITIVTERIGFAGVVIAEKDLTYCQNSDLKPYYHHACNQAQDRMLEKLKEHYLPNVTDEEWNPTWKPKQKMMFLHLATCTGKTSKDVKQVRFMAYVTQFKNGKTVGTTKLALDQSPTDDLPESKINPIYSETLGWVPATSSEETKASSSSS